MKVELTGFENDKCQYAYQGVRGGRPYENSPMLGGYWDGAGAFKSYPESLTYVKWRNPKTGREESQEIRGWLKERCDGQRFTQAFFNKLLQLNKGKKFETRWDSTQNCRVLDNLDDIITEEE